MLRNGSDCSTNTIENKPELFVSFSGKMALEDFVVGKGSSKGKPVIVLHDGRLLIRRKRKWLKESRCHVKSVKQTP